MQPLRVWVFESNLMAFNSGYSIIGDVNQELVPQWHFQGSWQQWPSCAFAPVQCGCAVRPAAAGTRFIRHITSAAVGLRTASLRIPNEMSMRIQCACHRDSTSSAHPCSVFLLLIVGIALSRAHGWGLMLLEIEKCLGGCHKRQKPQAPIRNRQTRKVANAKVLNRNANLT